MFRSCLTGLSPTWQQALGPAVTGIACRTPSRSGRRWQAVAGGGGSGGRLGGGGAGFRDHARQVLQSCFDPGWCLRFSSSAEWMVYEMACFLCFPRLCTETGTHSAFFSFWLWLLQYIDKVVDVWERGCSMEACERISHIFYVLLALFAWNLDLISLSPLFLAATCPCALRQSTAVLGRISFFSK